MIITPLLQLAATKQASDLFFSVGAPVNIKIEGITMPVNAQILDGDVVKRIAYEMMSQKQIDEFESEMELNFSFPGPRHRDLPYQRFPPARRHGHRGPLHQGQDRVCRRTSSPGDPEGSDHGKARLGAGGRCDRLREIHHARLDDRASQQHHRRPHTDDRRTDRIYLPARQIHRQPARDRHRHPFV